VKVIGTSQTEWFITDSLVEETTLRVPFTNNSNQYSLLRFSLKMRRVTTYYFLKILFPFSIITSVTLFSFLLAPDSGEKLTLNVTVLLSLVIYLQIITEYIPRGFSNLPILSFFSLSNFSLVYLSSALNVVVLNLYYKLPSFIPSKHNQLPYVVRLVLFKYIGRALLFKFKCRERGEPFSNPARRKTRLFNFKKQQPQPQQQQQQQQEKKVD
jgi:hypothetical protein